MDQIKDMTVVDCGSSQYIRPLRLHFTQNGRKRAWDALKVHDSVAIVVYNSTRDVLIFVRQFRPAVYINRVEMQTDADGRRTIDTERFPGQLGLTYELCAGIVDKEIPPLEIAREELLEECGYQVPDANLTRITGFRMGVGTSGAWQDLYYAEVTDDMKVASGGGNANEGEMIDVVEIPAQEGRKFAMDESINKPVGVLFGVMWFYDNVYDRKMKGTKRKDAE